MNGGPFVADRPLCPLSGEKGISYLFTSTKTIQRYQGTSWAVSTSSYKRLGEFQSIDKKMLDISDNRSV